MRQLYALLFALSLFGPAISAQTQPAQSVMKFFSARQYDDYQGAARMTAVRQLQDNDWQGIDSFYGLPDQYGQSPLHVTKTDLAPFVDNDGYVVYWVTEVAPQFPGGKVALQQYKQDVIGLRLSGPNDEVQQSVYIACTIASDGSLVDLAEAQPHGDWIPREIVEQCLDTVRYMPVWTPGRFLDKPVRTRVLVEFSLKE